MNAWRTIRLDECCQIVSGATPSTSVLEFWDGDICWATPKDLSDLEGPTINTTPRRITSAGLNACAATVLPVGSVLFSSRAPIGHAAINTVPMATNQGFKSFVPGNEIDARFLYYWLRCNRSYLESLGNGATFKEVSKAVVARIEIPLPPLPEQRRIAAILDQADALRAKRREALAKLDEMAQAIFVEMFGDPETNPRGWDETFVLGDLAEVVSGITKGRKTNDQAVREIPYLAVSNVQDQRLDLTMVKTIKATESEIRRYKLRKGDLVLTEGGDPDKLGRGVLWTDELEDCIHQNHIFRVRLTSAKLQPIFLAWLIGSQRGKKYFFKAAKQTTGIASINMTQLRAFPLLIPPKDLQTSFIEAIWRVRLIAEQLSSALSGQSLLFTSLQHRAFSGTL